MGPCGSNVGNGLGTFRGGALIGSGWQIYQEILSPGDFTGDGHVDVLGRRADGTLWMYAGNGRGGWAAGGKPRVGTGWQGVDQVMSPGDFTGDGRGDVLARKPDGTLWLYAGTGLGTLRGGVLIGTGWQGFAQILAGGDRDRDGRSDVLALRPDGTLLQYRGNGSRGFAGGGCDGRQGLGQLRPGGRHPLTSRPRRRRSVSGPSSFGGLETKASDLRRWRPSGRGSPRLILSFPAVRCVDSSPFRPPVMAASLRG